MELKCGALAARALITEAEELFSVAVGIEFDAQVFDRAVAEGIGIEGLDEDVCPVNENGIPATEVVRVFGVNGAGSGAAAVVQSQVGGL